MELSRAALSLERANGRPDPTLGGGVILFNESDDAAFLASVSFPLPLFDRNQGGIREAEANLAKAQEEHRAARVAVRTALANAYQALASAHAEAEALETEVLPAAQAAFDAASEGYRKGKFGYLDVLDAQQALFEARQQHIDALATYHKAVADVERLIGQSLASVPAK